MTLNKIKQVIHAACKSARDDGFASVFVLWTACATLMLLPLACVVSWMIMATKQVQGAADLAALAAASRSYEDSPHSCNYAQSIAESNEVVLDFCEIDQQIVVVRVTRSRKFPWLIYRELNLNAVARAGLEELTP